MEQSEEQSAKLTFPMNQSASHNSLTTGIKPTSSNSANAAIKRRRVTRACDECRKKKVKCDGKQPCLHCTVYSYNCTYQSPNTRNKKSAIAPEKQTLSMITAAVNQHHNQNNAQANLWAQPFKTSQQSPSEISDRNVIYKNIIKLMFPKLNFDEDQLNIASLMKLEKFEKVITYLTKLKGPGESINIQEITNLYMDGQSPLKAERMERQSSVSSMDDQVSVTSNSIGREIRIILPSKEVALKLIYTTWNEACVLFRFYHRPSLLEEVDLLYSIEPINYTDRQQKFLPFMYSILACGLLFSKLMTPPSSNKGSQSENPAATAEAAAAANSNESLEDDGFRYFMEARKLIDITNVGDIISIQTIVMMVLYLQCSARLSTCYSYIGIALRSALKEGLHRNLSIFQNAKNKLTPIEIDTRKRLFYTIYKMDIYINSLLGLPRSINEDEFDQEFPEELDDENITVDSFNYEEQQGRLSSAGCANHHTKLMLIISHIVKDLYPIKLHKKGGLVDGTGAIPGERHGVDRLTPEYTHSKVTEIEFELKFWLDNLPLELKPTDPNVYDSGKHIPKKFLLANCYLHLAFLNCQIMLYRPFIHFISNGTINRKSDPRSLIRGRNCIKVARMVVKLANKMIDQNLLIGTYWFSMYTIFFSIACLIYYFHFANYTNHNNSSTAGVNYAGVLFDDDLNIDMIKKDIEIGKKVLDCLKNNSNSSLRIFNILKNLFEQLNRRTATNSKDKNGNESILHGDENAAAEHFEQERKQSPMKDMKVESTFINFDSMNNFNSIDTPPRKRSMSAYFNPTFSLEANENFKLENDIESATTKPNKPHPLSQSVLDSTKNPSSRSLELPTAATSSYSDENHSTDDYMPGVIDKLDAQIFGRILPPYMLEKNAKIAAAVNGHSNSNSRLNSNSASNVDIQSYENEQGFDANVDLDQFDFGQLENLMFDNTIDQLDPFNPQYSQQPSPGL